jgi:two-component system response regulator CpxR
MPPLIVCIDDEATLCHVLATILRRVGAEVEAFTDAHAAIDRINRGGVALVLCDYRMPRLSGLDVLERMEARVPFVMISGDLDLDRVIEGRAVDGTVNKPFRPAELLALVRRLVPELSRAL